MAIIRDVDPKNTLRLEDGTQSSKGTAVNEENQIDHPALSRCQLQVLRLLGEGKSNREIADALCRSPNTVKLHVSAILHRLNLKSRTQAALIASDVEW